KPYARSYPRGGVHTPARARSEPSLQGYDEWGPALFQLLQKYTDERVSEWVCGVDNPYYLPTPNSYYRRRAKRTETTCAMRAQVRGVRAHFSSEDRLLLGDVCWAEFYQNRPLQQYLRGWPGT